jgi:hypothetical protein
MSLAGSKRMNREEEYMMTVEEAIERVYAVFVEHIKTKEDQEAADVFHDFIVNNVFNDD